MRQLTAFHRTSVFDFSGLLVFFRVRLSDRNTAKEPPSMYVPLPKSFGLGVLLLALAPGFVRAGQPGTDRPVLDAKAMSAKIDEAIRAKWTEKNVKPAPAASDAEYFRRLSLDLNGRIPTITQLKDFLDDDRADKRRIWVEVLMQGRDNVDLYNNHFTNYWRHLIFAQATNQQAQFFGFNTDPWFSKHVKENTGYDAMVRELLTTQQGAAFYQANENRPENIASATSRLFLGIKLECAQCHDDKSGGSWLRTQFWEYAAFFTNFNPQRGFQPQLPGGNGAAKIKIPDKDQIVEAKFLDGKEPIWRSGVAPQNILTEWMTSKDNPYFARAAVNRMWYYLLGTGLTDPVDHMANEDNPPSHPELLDELAFQFAAHGFDNKYLIRAITGSEAYRLTSAQTEESQEDPRLFARMGVKGMSPEQLFDSVLLAVGYRTEPGGNMNNRFNGFQTNTPRGEFVTRFTNASDKRTERQTSILQALYLMNGKFLNDAIELKDGCLDRIASAGPTVPMSRRIEELYIITLSRKPNEKEMEKMLKYVENGGAAKETRKALADIFWALLNSSEFILNH
jgi:hypothetical protein